MLKQSFLPKLSKHHQTLPDDLTENNIYTDHEKAAEKRSIWQTLRKNCCHRNC